MPSSAIPVLFGFTAFAAFAACAAACGSRTNLILDEAPSASSGDDASGGAHPTPLPEPADGSGPQPGPGDASLPPPPTTPDASPQDGSVPPSLDASSPPESGPPPPDATLPPADAGPTFTGYITFEQGPEDGGSGLTPGLFAQFYASDPNAGCTLVQEGACAAYACPTSMPPEVSAGTLTFAGGLLAGAVAVPPAANNDYSRVNGPAVYRPGDLLSVQASGATVPAFVAPPLTAPGTSEVLTAPAITSAGLTVPITAALDVAWFGGQPGGQFWLSGSNSQNTKSFLCTWDATAGQGVVPSGILAVIGSTSGYVLWGQQSSNVFTAGGWVIQELATDGRYTTASFQ